MVYKNLDLKILMEIVSFIEQENVKFSTRKINVNSDKDAILCMNIEKFNKL